MIGTSIPRLSSCSTMCGSAAAASSLFTVTRTSSDPARARDAICSTLEATSAVSVLVIDCTTTGASAPTRTLPMVQVTDLRRWIDAMWKVQFNRLNRAASAMAVGQKQPTKLHCKMVLHVKTRLVQTTITLKVDSDLLRRA